MWLIIFFVIAGLFFWLIWYLFFRSILWVAEPLIEYFENRDVERFSIDDIDKDKIDEEDLEQIAKNKLKISIKDFNKPIYLSKSFLQKAQKEPQKLGKTTLWIYKDCIFSFKPTEAKLRKTFGKEG